MEGKSRRQVLLSRTRAVCEIALVGALNLLQYCLHGFILKPQKIRLPENRESLGYVIYDSGVVLNVESEFHLSR